MLSADLNTNVWSAPHNRKVVLLEMIQTSIVRVIHGREETAEIIFRNNDQQ